MKKRCVLYARVSGDDRGKDGRNLEGQLEMGREYAHERGYTVVEELPEDDRGASGADIDLPQLNRIRDLARTHKFDILVVRELDRLSRNLAKQLIVEEELKNAGVAIEYVLGEYPDTPEGNLMKHVRATIAEYEREKIAERMVRARRNFVRAGNVLVHGRPPYGYRVTSIDGKRALEIHEAEARVVRLIFQWYTEGDGEQGPMSIYHIVKRLTDHGIPTPGDIDPRVWKRRGPGQWNRSTVRKILRRETYAGVWHYGKVKESKHGEVRNDRQHWLSIEVPAVVSRQTWEAAQSQMEENKRDSSRNLKYVYLMRRRLTCGSCGSKIRGSKTPEAKGGYRYYNCPAHIQRLDYATKCAMGVYFRVDWVDAMVWEWLRNLLLEPDITLQGLRAEQAARQEINKPLKDRCSVIDNLLDENRRQLERALDLHLTGRLSRAFLADRQARLESTIESLEQERSELMTRLKAQELTSSQIEDIMDFVTQVARGLEVVDADFNAQRRLVELLDVWGTLAIEDGQQVVHVRCTVGSGALSIATTNTVSVPQQHSADALSKGLALPFEVGLQDLGRDRVQIPVRAARDGAPYIPHLFERRRAGRRSPTNELAQAGRQHLPLGPKHPVCVLLVGQMAHDPTDAVHRLQPKTAVLLRNAV